MDELQMELTDEEARFLSGQIVENCNDSMLSYVLENDMLKFLECDSFQGIGMIIDEFPDNIRDTYTMAIAFSNFVYAMALGRNVLARLPLWMYRIFTILCWNRIGCWRPHWRAYIPRFIRRFSTQCGFDISPPIHHPEL